MQDTEMTGIQNELDFAKALNNKQYCQLNPNAAKFIKQLHPSVETNSKVKAINVGGKGLKPDVVVSVEDDDTNVSIKKGGGN